MQQVTDLNSALGETCDAIAGLKGAIGEASDAVLSSMRQTTSEQLIWLALQGLPLAPIEIPDGQEPAPVPRAFPITMSMLGTALGAIMAVTTPARVHEVALGILRNEALQDVCAPKDEPVLTACVEHIRCCYAQLRTMADDHAIEVLLDVVMQMMRRINEAVTET